MTVSVRFGAAEARIEDPFPVGRVNTWAVVADLEDHLAGDCAYVERDAVSGEAGGVLEQRREDALDDIGLDSHPHRPRTHELDRLALCRQGLAQGRGCAFCRLSRVAGC